MTQPLSMTVTCTPNLAQLLGAADEIASASQSFPIGTEHVLLALIRDPSAIPMDELRVLGMDPCVLLTRLAECALHIRMGLGDANY
ncbi:Clp protease N-terminal domain-containing protein [Nocardia sp. NBC_01388]|uniref:Clp protease N-terminal domain-containing protein n=1 Tax=Nocardia sp. NBC_01388 TaxID=2903596 RepID=UPI00324C1476